MSILINISISQFTRGTLHIPPLSFAIYYVLQSCVVSGPGSHSGDSGQSGSDAEHHSKKGGATATPNRVKRRSRAARLISEVLGREWGRGVRRRSRSYNSISGVGEIESCRVNIGGGGAGVLTVSRGDIELPG